MFTLTEALEALESILQSAEIGDLADFEVSNETLQALRNAKYELENEVERGNT